MIKLFFIAMVIVSSLQVQATNSSNQSNNSSKIHNSQQLIASAIKKSQTSQSNSSDAQVCGAAKKIDTLIAVKTMPEIQKVVALQYETRRTIVPHMGEHEGFVENSLIKTPSGYQKIQDLQVGDVIYGSDNNEKMVVDTFEQQASRFIRLTKGNETIHAACHQKFYLPQQNCWVIARDITSSDIVLSTDNQHISFDTIEIINQDINLYCITVQDHLFKVSSQEILVHNMAVPVAQILNLNFINLWQPIVHIFAGIVSLQYASTYSPFQEINGVIVYEPSQEKLSFDSKYNQLESVKKELTNTHSVLKAMNYSFKDQASLLNFIPIKQFDPQNYFKITVQYEGELNAEARLILTEYRQKKLEDIQEDICNLQIKIGLQVDEFIYRYSETIKLAKDHRNKATDHFYFTGILNPNCSCDTAKKYHEHYMIRDMIIGEVEDRMKEIEAIIKIFEKYNESSVIAQTSNILAQLVVTKKSIETSKKNIEKTKIDDEKPKKALEDYFKKHLKPLPNISTEVASVKAKLHKGFKESMPSRCKDIKYAKVVEPDKEPKDEEIPRIYVGASYHAKRASSTKSPAPINGQAALDRSFQVGPRVRVGVSKNQIVVLGRTLIKPQGGGSEWHGYATTWDDLESYQESDIIKTLKQNNLVKNNGKLL